MIKCSSTFSGLISGMLLCFVSFALLAQDKFRSESLIVYDTLKRTTDKAIPFDKAFTMMIPKFSTKGITKVHVYQAHTIKNSRVLVENKATSCDGSEQQLAIVDFEAKTNQGADTLMIYFPPLKPNVDFDVNIVRFLSGKNRDAILKINSLLADGKTGQAKKAYENLQVALTDRFLNRTYFSMNFGAIWINCWMCCN